MEETKIVAKQFKTDYSKLSRRELLLHAVLLLRTVNKYQSKEEQLEEYDRFLSDGELAEYIAHFHDPEPGVDQDPFADYGGTCITDDRYSPCSSNRDYGPSNPWDAPGMSVRDFI